jgi:1,4-alpha-glucan branching enzyme/maltooligosyltrehalose trehalohydrolase
MGEEWGSETPFLFFCDFEGELAEAVRDGRRREFAHFSEFADPAARERIPDPIEAATFESSKLAWDDLGNETHAARQHLVKELLAIRSQHIVPHLAAASGHGGEVQRLGARGLMARWRLPAARLTLLLNVGEEPISGCERPAGDTLYASAERLGEELLHGRLPGWSIAVFLERTG